MADGFIGQINHTNGRRQDHTVTGSGDDAIYRLRVDASITDGGGTANTKQLGQQLTTSEVGLVTNSVIHGQTTGGGGGYVDVKVTPSGALTVEATLSASSEEIGSVAPSSAASDTSGRFRTSSLITLFDGKILNAEDTLKWDIQGTGTSTYTNNAVRLSVTAGQYEIRQSRIFTPYFAGKPQLIEGTFANFANQTGVVKRFGYFSSNAVAPYDSDKDGWWIEADGTTYRLICSRSGTVTHNIPWTQWDNYAAISNYDWTKFTVSQVDLLWLGGAALRLFFVVNGVFTLVHTIDNHAGYQDGLIFSSPNQPVRYEIRSTTGSGFFDTICSQVASEGASANEQGQGVAIYTGSIACNVIGTVYALAGMRKTAANRNVYVPVGDIGVTNILTTATPESGILLLMLNPTLSAPLTWTANSRIETAVATTQTITNTGRILKAVTSSGAAITAQAPSAALRVLGVGIDNTMGTLVLGYVPTTTNQNVAAIMQALEY